MPIRFTLREIENAHAGVTSEIVGQYLKDLYSLGVVSYTTYISDGHSEYFDENGDKLASEAIHDSYEISHEANDVAARRAIELHGCKVTDYLSFSKQLAEAGVCKWAMNPIAMTCTFYSMSSDQMSIDNIPE
ncbi:DUF1398 family protein [Undibacterium sp.]|jgi:uncharacterized protein YbcV (DUF1398 family)|uniref:DUF1398 family protein n=1 Tax=Undibacterium sp. TaxID=1914977 RepID=UPI002BB7BF9B|nr:DUF1398 family protein [Undibacterium sp.]HTD02261.1 DUF1398 family protein [Undibacterium sp.]